MWLQANGLSFYVTIEGKPGAPWLVFSNSLGTNLTLWDKQVAVLGETFQIVRYDQRGHGRTVASEGDYTFDLLMQDAIALLDALKIRRAHFIGISMGGVTALGLAARYPQRLASAVICDAQASATPATSAAWDERIAIARTQGMDALVEPTIERWFVPDFVKANPPVLDKVRRMLRTTQVQGFVGCARALQGFDFWSVLPQITVPTLFIVGAQDSVLPEKMRAMHALVPGSTLIELEQAGHLSHLEQPHAFNQALYHFLRANAQSASQDY